MLNSFFLKCLRFSVVAILLSLSEISLQAKGASTLGSFASRANEIISKLTPNVGVFRKYRKLSPTQKLATTPLFFISNSQGSPYLQEDVQAGNPDQKLVVYFMSSEDGNRYLEEMTQGNIGSVNEFRLTATSMEKVIKKIKARKQSKRYGRYPINVLYRIQPSTQQCNNAEQIAGDGDIKSGHNKLKGVSIPMFSAKGVIVKRSNGETVTPYYFCYEDLLDDWKKVLKQSPSETKVPLKPAVQVYDFVDVMCLSQGITSDILKMGAIFPSILSKRQSSTLATSKKLSNSTISSSDAINYPAFVPQRKEIDLLRDYYSGKVGLKGEFQQARIAGMPR